jgi:hypothetical protein
MHPHHPIQEFVHSHSLKTVQLDGPDRALLADFQPNAARTKPLS